MNCGLTPMECNPGSHRPTKAIVLFHFHAHIDLCRPRIGLLRRLNPEMEMFGLFGGDTAGLKDARSLEACGIQHVYYDAELKPSWNKWKDTDLAVAAWYRSVGRSIPFDRVHVVQWDLLFFAALERVYPSMSEEAVALTGLIPLARIAEMWAWTRSPALAAGTERLLAQARHRFGYEKDPYACLGPGYSLSRTFIEQYSALGVDDAGHDELRLPLFAQILGVEIVDTGFYPRWMDPEVEDLFNANPKEIDPLRVEAELMVEGGRRVFHP